MARKTSWMSARASVVLVMIACLCVFRDEAAHLAGYLAHLRDYVDCFLACDDGSRDGGGRIFSRERKCAWLARTKRSPLPFHNEVANRLALLKKAREMGVDWILYADADTRVDLRFLPLIERYARPGRRAKYALRLRDLWDSRKTYRCDGPWGRKFSLTLFSLDPFERYWEPGRIHTPAHPPRQKGKIVNLEYNLYHLGSLTGKDRRRRVRIHKLADPDGIHQPQGYDYLADESGLVLEDVPAGSLYPS